MNPPISPSAAPGGIDQMPLLIQRVGDPARAERFAREYRELQDWAQRQRNRIGKRYNCRLIALWGEIQAASQTTE